MSYANRKFGHCCVSWVIEGCCFWFFPMRRIIESPFFYVDGQVQTKWRITVVICPDDDVARFRLTRLNHGNKQPVRVEFRLSFMGKWDNYPIADVRKEFHPGETTEVSYLKLFIRYEMITSIDLRLKLIVHAPDPENISECEDVYLRQLSKDLKGLFRNPECNSNHFVEITIDTKDTVYANKSIFLQRVKNQKFVSYMTNRSVLKFASSEFTYEDLIAVIEFLYTADISPAVRYPRTGIFYLAENFDVPALVAYYHPYLLSLHSTTKLHEFQMTWTITGLASRQEYPLISPSFIGELYECVIKISPEFQEINGGSIGIRIEIYLDAERHVCFREIALVTETHTECLLLEDSHKTFDGLAVFESAIMITDKNSKILTDGRATIFVKVRLSTSLDNSSVGKSLIIRKPYCDQQNYIELSQDMRSVYEKFKNRGISLKFLLDGHGCILKARNPDFASAVFGDQGSNTLDLIKLETLDQLLYFLYSGKFREKLDFKDIFYLYDAAVRYDFDILRYALISNLKEHLFKDIEAILDFASSKNIDDLKAYINERVYMENIRKRIDVIQKM